MPFKFSRLRKLQWVTKAWHRGKFDTSGGKSPYSQDPRNFCPGTMNESASWKRSGDRLLVRSRAKTDFWRKTLYRYLTDNGHFFYVPVISSSRLA